MFIYKITNKINGKVYIGQTMFKISERMKQHIYAALRRNTKSILYSAIQKYGPENFTIEEIDGANSLSELNYLETHYIYKFNSLVPNGYNLSSGGGNKKTHELTKEKISKALKGRKISKYHIECLIDRLSIEVHQYDLKGNFIKSWKSAMEAARSLEIGNSEINKCCRKERKSCGGFMWSFSKEKSLPLYKRKKTNRKGFKAHNSKQCALLNKNGNIVKKYETAKVAAIENNCDHSSVVKVCNGKLKNVKGFVFKYI